MPRRVLVVDDEPDVLLMLRMTLEDGGYEVVLAPDGQAGLERMAEHRPDLVLLDLMMPVLDGWAVLERKRREGDDTPVVVLSAKSDPADIDRALALGALDYVGKPFDLDRLMALVASILSKGTD